MINKVISVCTVRDIETFQLTAKWVSKFIPAAKYVVVVPHAEIDIFKSKKLGKYSVISENKHSKIADCLNEKLGKNHKRFGWYFQQFIKLSELDDGSNNALNLIWDADTIPLKKINFEQNGKIYFFQGSEYNKEYFTLTRELLNFSKISKRSFIAQNMPCKVSWIKEFKKEIQTKYKNKDWYEEIIKRINVNHGAGFSEYETLGTFLLKNHPEDIILGKAKWYRGGNKLIGGIKNFHDNQKWLSKRYHYVAFEHWDCKNTTWKYTLKKFLFKYL
jgi:hypothetical protein